MERSNAKEVFDVIEAFTCIASAGALYFRTEVLGINYMLLGRMKVRHVFFFWFHIFYFPILNLRQRHAETCFKVILNEV